MDLVTFALSKKYTNDTADALGAVKGSPCIIKSAVHQNGRTTITFEWKGYSGQTEETQITVLDGTPIYEWQSGDQYNYSDLVIYASCFYRCITPNSDIEFDNTKWNEIGSPDGNYDIVQNSSLLPSIFTSADRKMYYCIEDAAFYLWDGYNWEFQAATSALNDTLNVTKTVGGISSGSHYTEGTSIETILRDMLSPTEYPTFTNPSASISSSISNLLEKGSSVNAVLTVNFNRGTINPAYGTSGKRSGAATSYKINNGKEQVGNEFNVIVNENYDSFTATVKYAAGEQPKDSTGANYSSPLPAGSVNSNTISYEFVNAIWANTTSADSMTKQTLISKSTKVKQFSFPATTVTNPEIFDIPASWTVTTVEVLNTLNNQWETAIDQFDISDATHDDAAGASTAYKRYSCNLGITLGARSVRVKWS